MLPKNPAVFAKMSAVSEWRVADATITALLGTRGPDGEDLLRLLPKFVAVGLALDESEFLEIKLDPTQFDVVPLLQLNHIVFGKVLPDGRAVLARGESEEDLVGALQVEGEELPGGVLQNGVLEEVAGGVQAEGRGEGCSVGGLHLPFFHEVEHVLLNVLRILLDRYPDLARLLLAGPHNYIIS